MIRIVVRWATAAVLVLLTIASTSRRAWADMPFAYALDKLTTAGDFRVRTQAALALGNSNSQAAVKPLCAALEDSSDAVRSAAAAALGKLGRRDAVACLKPLADDSNASVRSVAVRAIDSIEHGAAKVGPPPPPGPNDSYYVSIGPTTDRTGRDGTSVADLVHDTIQEKLLGLHGFAIAPPKENPAKAKRILKEHRLKGFFLQTSVERPSYANGNLTLQVRLTLWSYPSKALKGEFSPKLTQSGTEEDDTDSEDGLIKMAVERAVDSFSQMASTTD